MSLDVVRFALCLISASGVIILPLTHARFNSKPLVSRACCCCRRLSFSSGGFIISCRYLGKLVGGRVGVLLVTLFMIGIHLN